MMLRWNSFLSICTLRIKTLSSEARLLWELRVLRLSFIMYCEEYLRCQCGPVRSLVVNISARRCRLMWLTLHRDPGSWVLLVTARVGGGPAVFNFKCQSYAALSLFVQHWSKQAEGHSILFAVHTHWLTDELSGFGLNQPFWLNCWFQPLTIVSMAWQLPQGEASTSPLPPGGGLQSDKLKNQGMRQKMLPKMDYIFYGCSHPSGVCAGVIFSVVLMLFGVLML